MSSWKVNFHIIGNNFNPYKVDFNFSDENQPDEIQNSGIFKGERYGYGSASYIVPKNIERSQKFQHLADTFVPMMDELRMAGSESWHIDIVRLYFAQNNEELDANEITQIARLNCSVSYSAHSVSEKEEENVF